MPSLNAEQIQAAQAETRAMLADMLPRKTPARPSQWAVDFIDTRLTLPRCKHLRARPVQPQLLTAWDGWWLCRRCCAHRDQIRQNSIAAGRYTGLGVVEEGTCDGCRVYCGAERLTPAVMRVDLWTVICALCPRCERRAASPPVPHSDG